jgi:hypothetical protein
LASSDAQQARGHPATERLAGTGMLRSVTNYAFEEGRENLELAETMDGLATTILDNLAALVESLTRSY